jgi:hypothetical protein
VGVLRLAASEIQKSYRDSPPRRLACEERRKGALRVRRGTERSGPGLFFKPNGLVFLRNILLRETTPLCIFSIKR